MVHFKASQASEVQHALKHTVDRSSRVGSRPANATHHRTHVSTTAHSIFQSHAASDVRPQVTCRSHGGQCVVPILSPCWPPVSSLSMMVEYGPPTATSGLDCHKRAQTLWKRRQTPPAHQYVRAWSRVGRGRGSRWCMTACLPLPLALLAILIPSFYRGRLQNTHGMAQKEENRSC